MIIPKNFIFLSIAKLLLMLPFIKHINRRYGVSYRLFLYKQRIVVLILSKLNKKIFIKYYGHPRTHYYHFIVDLVFPIWFIAHKAFADTFIAVLNIESFPKRLQALFPNMAVVKTERELPKDVISCTLPSIHLRDNSHTIRASTRSLENFRKYVGDVLDIDKRGEHNKVLLVERIPATGYFGQVDKNHHGIEIGGSQRRSIPNHQELASAIMSMVKPEWEFHNLQLENFSLKKQVDYFDKSVLCIAQHGASLTNCIWMKMNSNVVEIRDPSHLYDVFKNISKIRNHNYFQYNVKGDHPVIDIKDFKNWISGLEDLKRFFKSTNT